MASYRSPLLRGMSWSQIMHGSATHDHLCSAPVATRDITNMAEAAYVPGMYVNTECVRAGLLWFLSSYQCLTLARIILPARLSGHICCRPDYCSGLLISKLRVSASKKRPGRFSMPMHSGTAQCCHPVPQHWPDIHNYTLEGPFISSPFFLVKSVGTAVIQQV